MAEYVKYNIKGEELESTSYNYCEYCGVPLNTKNALYDTFSYFQGGFRYMIKLFFCNETCKERRASSEYHRN